MNTMNCVTLLRKATLAAALPCFLASVEGTNHCNAQGGPGLAELTTTGLANGIYVAELRMDGQRLEQAKVTVLR
ncbi:MAG TPA: hypothetical protein PKD45_01380 [Flavobacteriales bacterium]|nr:hypothetical protein [Flavobacteriales bacterium]